MRNRNSYPENWNDTVRPDILKRDGYQCTKCGVQHRSYVLDDGQENFIVLKLQEFQEFREQGKKVYRIYLQIAHLDNNPSNCEYSNLISLCPKHHLKLDTEFRNIMRIASKARVLSDLGATNIAR